MIRKAFGKISLHSGELRDGLFLHRECAGNWVRFEMALLTILTLSRLVSQLSGYLPFTVPWNISVKALSLSLSHSLACSHQKRTRTKAEKLSLSVSLTSLD